LFGDSANFRVQKVLASAKLGGIQLELVNSAPTAIASPLGITPALEDGKVTLFGAESISKYLLKDKPQYPKTDENEIDQWLFLG